MAIKKEFTAYNGTQCDFHGLASFELHPHGICIAKMGSYREVLQAKLRQGEVVIRSFTLSGISRSENIRHDIYQQIILLPEFSGGAQV